MEKTPLILVTNDDGIDARGLWALVDAVLPLGEILVVAPDRQWSGGGRSMPPDVTGHLDYTPRQIKGRRVAAYAVDASPALAVVHAMTELALRKPDLVVSGINSGANLGTEVTISGTVGAALEAGAFGIPALAVSLEMDPKFHLTGDDAADYRAARFHAQQFARSLLASPLAPDVQALSINVPASATPFTPWRLTRASRHRGYTPMAPDRANGHGRPRYREIDGGEYTEADSDIWAVKVDRIVSVTPLSLNLTSRVSFRSTTQILANGMAERAALADVAKTRPQSTPPTPSAGDSDGHDSWGWSELPDLQASLQIRRRS